MQTSELKYTREATESLVKIIDSTYVKAELKQVANNVTQLNFEERSQLLRLLEDFDYLSDGTSGDWDTDPVSLELNPYSKPFNSKYYTVSKINKEAFCKELKC